METAMAATAAASSSSPTSSAAASSSSWFSAMVRGRSAKSMPAPPTVASGNVVASLSESRGSGSRKKQLKGALFKYGSNPAQVAFKTGDFTQQVVFLGGLTDGLLATKYVKSLKPDLYHFDQVKYSSKQIGADRSSSGKMRLYLVNTLLSFENKFTELVTNAGKPVYVYWYIEPLSIALENNNWSLVQPLLSSSYIGYGTASLQQDALEIDQLISYLINNENSEGVVLLGHSTGCQDIVHYMKTNLACSKAVRGVILQAPVSDREYRALLPETPEMIDLAAKMISEGKGNDLMPREADSCAPITAYRYHSLCAYMGDDDMFSSDLSEDQLKQRLGHMASTPCQVIFSMADEYVPEYVDKKALVDRLCRALGGAEKVEIEWGNHSLSNRVQEAVDAIIDFVKREGPNGWDDPWS